MKCWLGILVLGVIGVTSRTATLAQAAPTPARQPIAAYIHAGWDTLSRSMTECKSVVDPKVTTTPVLYLPAGLPEPPAVTAMRRECQVDVERLPRKVGAMGDVTAAELPKEGLLYLPNPYVVPGGRFNEMYGWDSYFILLGLVADSRVALAKGMVENFFFEIENYGAVLNANRTYYLTRSQPPLLSSMIAEVYAHTNDKTWLRRAYGYATRDYALWTRAPHLALDHAGKPATGLARYDDLGDGPVPEMADDSTYYPDVIRTLLAHPEWHTGYLVPASQHPDAAEAAQLAQTSCDLRASRICAAAWAGGYRLNAAFFHGDRAMRESGYDTTFRFGPYSGSTEQYAPVCLNSLLFKYAQDMAAFARALGLEREAEDWEAKASARKAAVDRYLWNQVAGMYFDFNTVTAQPSDYRYASTFYPLWAGMASPAQAAAVRAHLSLFEHDGGLAMSDRATGVQWDLPYGWAPANWFSAAGLARYGFHDDAARLAHEFMGTVEANYERDGTIREKYDVVSGSANIAVAAGYKSNVIGFGWTNGVYLQMQKLLTASR